MTYKCTNLSGWKIIESNEYRKWPPAPYNHISPQNPYKGHSHRKQDTRGYRGQTNAA